jgi:hypothetical protein
MERDEAQAVVDRAIDETAKEKRIREQADPVVELITNFWQRFRSGEIGDESEVPAKQLRMMIEDSQRLRRLADEETGAMTVPETLDMAYNQSAKSNDAYAAVVRNLVSQVQWLLRVVNHSGLLQGPEFIPMSEQVAILREAHGDIERFKVSQENSEGGEKGASQEDN